jgi:hypothetical protein
MNMMVQSLGERTRGAGEVNGLRAGRELHQQINVAIRTRLVPADGPERGEPPHAEPTDLRFSGHDPSHGVDMQERPNPRW